MLRFIIERHEQNHNFGTDRKDYYTIDLSIPELEAALMLGVSGEMGFESHRLIGVEILPPYIVLDPQEPKP